MKNIALNKNEFLIKYVGATGIAWPIALIISFILAHLVNIIYPKETNLVVGIGYGSIIGFAQWMILKKYFTINYQWILGSTVGIGLPYIIWVVIDEVIKDPDTLKSVEGIIWITLLLFGCFITGLIQRKSIQLYSTKSGFWILFCIIGWGSALLISKTGIGIFVGGLVLGLITGLSLLWLLKFPTSKT